MMNYAEKKTRREIEAKLANSGDYVKIDYLSKMLKMQLDSETRKFVQNTLSKIYENKGMFFEAAKLAKSLAESGVADLLKIQNYMNAVALYIRAGYFDEADSVLRSAVSFTVRESDKTSLKNDAKKFYFDQAAMYEKNKRRDFAKRTYEKILSLQLDGSERLAVQRKLLSLYEQLGNVREFTNLRNAMR